MYRVGISGWTYKGWRGRFYPEGLRQKDELAFAGRAFNSIEINGSFYSMQRPASYRTWYEATPAGFIFAIKGPRFITHMKKLANVEAALANFFASGLLCLGEKMGPILWQLPPNLGYSRERLERFFNLLPRTTTEAATLAHGYDRRFSGRVALEAEVKNQSATAWRSGTQVFSIPISSRCCGSMMWPLSLPTQQGSGRTWKTSPRTLSTFASTARRSST